MAQTPPGLPHWSLHNALGSDDVWKRNHGNDLVSQPICVETSEVKPQTVAEPLRRSASNGRDAADSLVASPEERSASERLTYMAAPRFKTDSDSGSVELAYTGREHVISNTTSNESLSTQAALTQRSTEQRWQQHAPIGSASVNPRLPGSVMLWNLCGLNSRLASLFARGPTLSSSPMTAASTRSICWSSRARAFSWSRSRVGRGGCGAMPELGLGRPTAN